MDKLDFFVISSPERSRPPGQKSVMFQVLFCHRTGNLLGQGPHGSRSKVDLEGQGHWVKKCDFRSRFTVLHVMINAMGKGQRWVKNSLKVMILAAGLMSSFFFFFFFSFFYGGGSEYPIYACSSFTVSGQSH